MKDSKDANTNQSEAALHKRIRNLAKRHNLGATRRKGLWFFSLPNNYLNSPESGLDDEEAIEYLTKPELTETDKPSAGRKPL